MKKMMNLDFKNIIKSSPICFYVLFCSVIFTAGFMQSCMPRTQDITLTYLVEDNGMHYQRLGGAILLGDNPKMKVTAKVTNTSDYGGVFKFYATLSSQGNTIEFEAEKYIASGATFTFEQLKEINPYSFEANVKVDDWGIVAPTKTIQIK